MSRLDKRCTSLERDSIGILGIRREETDPDDNKAHSQHHISCYAVDRVIQQCIPAFLRKHPGTNKEHWSDAEPGNPSQPESTPEDMPEDPGPQACGLCIDGSSHKQFYRVNEITLITCDIHPTPWPCNRTCPIDSQHRMDVVMTRYPAPQLDHRLVVPAHFHRTRGKHRNPVHFGAETCEHRTRATDVDERTVGSGE